MTRVLQLATTDAGNDLLARDPLALLLGMMLDQQITMEKAFTSPRVLADRMGVETLDAEQIATAEPEVLLGWFATPPALHRFPKAMAQRAAALCRVIVDDFDGRADTVWAAVDSGDELVARIATLPGFGEQKAKIFTALLAKQFGVQPQGWRQAAGDYGLDGYRSIADVVDAASRVKVREFKKQAKAAARAGR